MTNRVLKKLLFGSWQEIVFITSLGILLFEIIKFNLSQTSMDGWDLALLSLVLPLFTCLIGQLYWKNKTLSIFLSILLTMGSIIVVFMAVYFVGTTSSELLQAISMLIFGIFLLFSAISMTRKNKNSTENYLVEFWVK